MAQLQLPADVRVIQFKGRIFERVGEGTSKTWLFQRSLNFLRGNPGRRRIRPESATANAGPDVRRRRAIRASMGGGSGRGWHLGSCASVCSLWPMSAVCGSIALAYDRWATAETAVAVLAAADPVTRGLMVTTANGNTHTKPAGMCGEQGGARHDQVCVGIGLTPASRRHLASNADRPAAKFDGLT